MGGCGCSSGKSQRARPVACAGNGVGCVAVLVWSAAFVPSKEGCWGRHVEAATMTPFVRADQLMFGGVMRWLR